MGQKDRNTALGASSPAKPAFTKPEPLSHTKAVCSSSSSDILGHISCISILNATIINKNV